MNFHDSSEFEHSAVLDHPAPAVDDYRTFRRRCYAQARKADKAQRHYGWADDVPEAHPLTIAKGHLQRARVSLAWDLKHHPERLARTRHHALRMLGIPQELDVPRIWWKSVGYSFFDMVAPYETSFAWLRGHLGSVRTFEGRKVIMEGPLRVFVAREYSERQDFLIRQLKGPIHPERLKDLECRSPSWMATHSEQPAEDKQA